MGGRDLERDLEREKPRTVKGEAVSERVKLQFDFQV